MKFPELNTSILGNSGCLIAIEQVLLSAYAPGAFIWCYTVDTRCAISLFCYELNTKKLSDDH